MPESTPTVVLVHGAFADASSWEGVIEKFRAAFAADLPARQAALMAATQRPVAELAFSEATGDPAWRQR